MQTPESPTLSPAANDWRSISGHALAPLGRKLTAGNPRVVFFHRLGEGSERLLPAAIFEAQLQYLKRHFHVMPLAELAAGLARGETLPKRAVALTFDDGYADFAEAAYPLLCAYEVPATLFVVSRFASGELWLWFDQIRYVCEHSTLSEVCFGSGNTRWSLHLNGRLEQENAWNLLSNHCLTLNPLARKVLLDAFAQAAEVVIPKAPPREFRALSFDELRSLDPSLISIGAHTRTHPILSTCSPLEQHEEILGSKEDLEHELSRPVNLFAYPNGRPADFDARSMSIVRTCGFVSAFTSSAGLIESTADPYALPRVGATHNMGFFRREIDGLTHIKARLSCSVAKVRRL